MCNLQERLSRVVRYLKREIDACEDCPKIKECHAREIIEKMEHIIISYENAQNRAV